MAATVVERSCSLLVYSDKPASANEMREALEGGDPGAKAAAMKQVISQLLNGESLPQIFITIVRYVLPSEDHTVQKLLLLYMEIIEKTGADGRILPEMILICQNLRNNLQHPNEYIRGVTLRFLCRIKEAEIIEPLIPSIMANLEHRHSFVRRNAVLAIDAIYRLPNGEQMLSEAPETVEKFLGGESDLSARRNAFLMLYNNAQERALAYLLANVEAVTSWGDILQTVALDLIRKVCRTNPAEKGKYIKVIISLLSTNSTAVVYECASSLVAMSSAPTAIRAAANCYTQLLSSQSDNNVKLIVLDRLAELKLAHREVMQDVVMDVLRALGSPNADIRRKTLDIALDLITPRNIDEVVATLKKEIIKTQSRDASESSGEYRQMLVQAVHACAVKFPDVAGAVVHLLMDFLGDSNTASALDVVFFVREIAETNAALREPIVQRLLDTFYQIRSSRVATCALWIIGEYCSAANEIEAALSALKAALGPTPFFHTTQEDAAPDAAGTEAAGGAGSAPAAVPAPPPSKRPAVLSDGTYATQSAAVETALAAAPASAAAGGAAVPSLRALLLARDFFLGSAVGSTLTKLVLRLAALAAQPAAGVTPARVNAARAEAMLYITSMLRLGAAPGLGNAIDSDSSDRLRLCLQILAAPEPAVVDVWLRECRASFARMTREKQGRDAEEAKARAGAPASQPDDLIDFYHLKSRKGLSQVELEDEVATDLARATGFGAEGDAANRKLNRMLQLTGFSDPVFAEAYVTVHQYDIVMDVTVVNRTAETLQNVCLELATMGDLKLVERPQNYTLAPGASRAIRANIKVSSTETGVIFGNIVFEGAAPGGDRAVVVLNDIHIDIMDYISPATCADVAFRNMWAEFEWENKVAVNTSITDVQAFLDHIVASTNMRCLTPRSALQGKCGFLAANLYAKSVFGEDALVNVSVEKQPGDGKLSGNIRIRSKTQGIALSLGDKITLRQRGP